MNKNYLITGVAGFIGYFLTKSLLNDGHKVIGIDNINDYYNRDLKNSRLSILGDYDNFSFHAKDISCRKSIDNVFSSNEIDSVVNLAAQAGVRYSIENPYAYLDSNLLGFVNMIELTRQYKINSFVYASSSSVYGGNTRVPFSEFDRVDTPISLYAATKRSNELIAHTYSHLYGINTTGLRFFTVYGPWGRPDMAYYSFTKKIYNNEQIDVYNNGKMKRDFTFIDDIVDGIKLAIHKNYRCELFNLGNNQSEELMDMIYLIEKYLNKKAKINFLSMQPGDVKETFADIDKSAEKLNFNPKVSLEKGIKSFTEWYLDKGLTYE